MKATQASPKSDWAAVKALIDASFAYMAPRLGHPAVATQSSALRLSRELSNGPVFLIESLDPDPRVLACLFCRPSRDVANALYIGKLAVDHRHRSKGLARTLVDAAAKFATDSGFDAVTLDTGVVFDDLIRTFEAMDFQRLDRADADPGIITMIRPL